MNEASPASVPPDLASTYVPADRTGFLAGPGARLRYALWNAAGTPRGTAIVLQGRAEFIEKYATETVGELRTRGFAVAAIDLRGQGLSDRPLTDRNKGHVDDFSTFVADLRLFLEAIVAMGLPQPCLALSHSTGGNVLLRLLAERGARPLSRAVFVSPMTGLPRTGLLEAAIAVASPFGIRDDEYMLATGPYDLKHRRFATNDVTTDERRYRFTDSWFAADRRLVLGGPTIGWLRQGLRSIDRLDEPGVLERIDLPVMVVSTLSDRVVDPASHARATERIRGANLVMIEGAKHEILMETDARLAAFWSAFDKFAA